jgi:hypothetical protein
MTELALPDGSPALATASAPRLGRPPSWARGVGPALALFILLGLVLDQPMLTAIATIAMVVFLVFAIITFIRSRKPVTIALSTEAVHIHEDGRWTSHPLTLLMGVVEAEAKVGPNTLHLDVPDGRLSFTWRRSPETERIVAALRRASGGA